jgi:hypothetical protein
MKARLEILKKIIRLLQGLVNDIEAEQAIKQMIKNKTERKR